MRIGLDYLVWPKVQNEVSVDHYVTLFAYPRVSIKAVFEIWRLQIKPQRTSSLVLRHFVIQFQSALVCHLDQSNVFGNENVVFTTFLLYICPCVEVMLTSKGDFESSSESLAGRESSIYGEGALPNKVASILYPVETDCFGDYSQREILPIALQKSTPKHSGVGTPCLSIKCKNNQSRNLFYRTSVGQTKLKSLF